MKFNPKNAYVLILFFILTNCFVVLSANARTGEVLNYPFEQSVDDSSGNDLDGILLDGTYSQDSKEGNYSLQFDGIDDAVEIADDELLDITESITIAAWAKTGDTTQNNYIAYKKTLTF